MGSATSLDCKFYSKNTILTSYDDISNKPPLDQRSWRPNEANFNRLSDVCGLCQIMHTKDAQITADL